MTRARTGRGGSAGVALRQSLDDYASREFKNTAEFANRTIVGAFAARSVVLRAADPTPLAPLRLPKHVRCRCATPRRGFVLTGSAYASQFWPSQPAYTALIAS